MNWNTRSSKNASGGRLKVLGSNPKWAIIIIVAYNKRFGNRCTGDYFFTLKTNHVRFLVWHYILFDQRVSGFILGLRMFCIFVLMHFTTEFRLFFSLVIFLKQLDSERKYRVKRLEFEL